MSLFTSILKGLQNKVAKEREQKEIINMCIAKVCTITLTKDTFILKDQILTIRTNPTIKMALLLKKEKIIQELNKQNITVTSIK